MNSSFSTLRYTIYGLTLECAFLLPELSAITRDASPPDLVVELGAPLSTEAVKLVTSSGKVEGVLQFGPNRSHVLFYDVGRFTISDGCHILVEPLEGCDPSTWRLPLLGSIMALLLEQRGHFVLHAGALDMGGFAVAFVGEKGQGKSTLNAALSCVGYPLFSDDVVALTWSETQNPDFPETLPGFAQIKLVPDAVRAVLKSEPSNWPTVASGVGGLNKRSFMAPLVTQPLPLRHVFILSSLDESEKRVETVGGGVCLRALAPQEALTQLIPHTFGARFGELYLKDERKRTHFLQCARVVSQCQVWELARRRDLALLPSTIEIIERAVGAQPQRT